MEPSHTSVRNLLGVLTTLTVWFAALVVGLGGVSIPVDAAPPINTSALNNISTIPGHSADVVEPILPLAARGRAPIQPPAIKVSTVTITRGDTLSGIFQEYNLSARELQRILKSTDHGRNLRRIFIGDKLHYATNTDGQLDYLAYQPNPRIKTVFERIDDGVFRSSEVEATIEMRAAYRHVVIDKGKSPISAGLAAGIRREETIVDLTRALEWDIDFWHEIRPGDEYRVLYFEEYIDGEYYTDGQIHALEFTNRGQKHHVFFFNDPEGGIGFYFRDGSPTRKQWLKAPLEYVRISSNFNPKRLHPILKMRRPHNGVDYAAPMGTPVRATSDGVVRKSGYTRNNGNYVFLTHVGQFETRYLHLQKYAKNLKAGTSVRQGEIIGWVGMTGLATGPHLHYEILHNGRHTNPRLLKVPPSTPLTGETLERFKLHVSQLEEQMQVAHMIALQAQEGAIVDSDR